MYPIANKTIFLKVWWVTVHGAKHVFCNQKHSFFLGNRFGFCVIIIFNWEISMWDLWFSVTVYVSYS